MSATLRYDIGYGVGCCLFDNEAGAFTDDPFNISLGVMQMKRWAGLSKPRTEVVTFAIKLPRKIDDVMRLIERIQQAWYKAGSRGNAVACNSLDRLVEKLRLSIGVPPSLAIPEEEKPFIAEIFQKGPQGLTPWLVYADWLEEHGCWRGELIRRWSDPKKAMKVKYGIPVFARRQPKEDGGMGETWEKD